MNTEMEIESFKIIGISVRTTNENGKSATDIMQLWQQFYADNISFKIPGKIDNDIYSIYTDYESNYTAGYTTIIGHKVSSIDNVPEGLVGREFQRGDYLVFTAHGKIPDAVINTWQKIWDRDKELNRSYSADFEVYPEKSQDSDNPEVDIYIAKK